MRHARSGFETALFAGVARVVAVAARRAGAAAATYVRVAIAQTPPLARQYGGVVGSRVAETHNAGIRVRKPFGLVVPVY